MAISKIVYKSSPSATPVTWMDVTAKTVTASSMLNGTTALKNDGTDITGNIASKTSSNLSASGATVTAEAGYYASSASKSVASGTEGTPTATKGTVSNHSVTVTPSVTNTAGYISGGTHSGTAVTVNVSELESGTKSILSNGTLISVSGYSSVDVAVPNTYSAADEGKVVSSGALVSQTSDTVTQNGTVDTTLINSLTVNVSGSGGITWDDFVSRTVPDGAVICNTATTIPAYCFYQNKAAHEWQFYGNEVTNVDATAFRDCTYVTEIHLPKLTTMASGGYFAHSATRLALVDLGKLTTLRPNAFNNCSNLKTIILRRTSITALSQTAVFTGTPFASGGSGGTIYIPKDLYDHLGDNSSSDYKAASNWSTIEGYGTITWAKIEGSIYEL